ncbi:hypothetical protein V8Z74_14830 [Comamonas sp. w2-DMI]|uniref:hypothetical protein n=1 Tax=Comamonas sp. w2-DMI TaxID=3126391 RepID=UPI0032E415CF
MFQRKLLAIVSVEESKKVRCQYPGCGHPIYRSIHVVRAGEEILLIGSTCITKDSNSYNLGEPAYTEGGSGGRLLSPEERLMLIENTAALIERLRNEFEQRSAIDIPKIPPWQARYTAPNPRIKNGTIINSPSPWAWVDPARSLLLLKMPDGSVWLRVQARGGKHHLVPFPKFEGWDEILPSSYGQVNETGDGYVLADLIGAIQYMRSMKPVVDLVCSSISSALVMAKRGHSE